MVATRQVVEPLEQTVGEQRGDGVVDRAVPLRDADEGAAPERLELGVLAPIGRVAAIPGFARVIGDDDARTVEELPHRVIDRVGRRPPATGREDGTGAHDEHARPLVQRPGHLVASGLGIDQAEIRRGEDPALVIETPVVEHPSVERVEDAAGRFGIAEQRLLHPDTQRGEHEATLDVLAIHELEARTGLSVGGTDRIELAERSADVGGRRLPAEVCVEAAGPGHRIELRIGDEAVDLPAHHQPGAAPDLGPLHAPASEVIRDVPGEGVRGLVVVIVGIEQGEIEIGHETSVRSERAPIVGASSP